MNPFLDFSTLTLEELLDKNKELTQTLYKTSTGSPVYQQLLDMRDMVQLEYNERMMIQLAKSKQGEEVIDIGNISSTTYSVDYRDDQQKFIDDVVAQYTKKDSDE